MENLLGIVVFLIIGLILKKVPGFPKDTSNTLNLFVIYVSLPALVLLKIAAIEFSAELLLPVFISYITLFLAAAAVLLLSRLFKLSREITGSLLLLVPLGNTSFFGLPMVYAFFGEAGIPYAVLYDQLGSFFALAVYGTLILSFYSVSSEKPGAKVILKKIFTFPPLIAVFTALLLKPFDYPAAMVSILKMLEATLVPLVMVAVGLQISFNINRKILFPLAAGLSLKLIILPLIITAAAFAFGFKGDIVKVSIFEAAMPPMVTAGALAVIGGLHPKLSSAMVGAGLLLSFITLPLFYFLLNLLF